MIDLSGRTILQLKGPDRVRYLNGQVTNDVSKLKPGSALQACVTDIKGKLEAEIFIRIQSDLEEQGEHPLLIDGPPELREQLHARLDRYIIADDCELVDVSDRFNIFHELSADRANLSTALPQTGFSVTRFGVPGTDFFIPSEDADLLREELEAKGSVLDESSLLLHRIRHRSPAWGFELRPGILPAEARLDATAIDFHKGCYIGQEVISRIKSVGRVNRSLQLMVACEPGGGGKEPLQPHPGHEITIESEGDSPALIGRVSSIAWDPDIDRVLALGFVKRGHETPGTRVLLRREGENILSCPFEIRKTLKN